MGLYYSLTLFVSLLLLGKFYLALICNFFEYLQM